MDAVLYAEGQRILAERIAAQRLAGVFRPLLNWAAGHEVHDFKQGDNWHDMLSNLPSGISYPSAHQADITLLDAC